MKMRKIAKVYIIMSFIIGLSINCSTTVNVGRIFQANYNGYSVLSFKKGNFTDSKFDEYIIFLKDNNKYRGLSPADYNEVSKYNDIDKVIIVVITNNKIFHEYNLDITSGDFHYTDKWITSITRGNPQFGPWDGYCFVTDFNGNGLDEVVFFELSGRAFLPYIYEFRDSSMRAVLSPPPFKSVGMTEIRTLNENGKKIIRIYGYGGEGIPAGKRDWYNYAWDGTSRSYVIVNQGIE